MPKTKRKTRRKGQQAEPRDSYLAPTDERASHGRVERAGVAFRLVAPIRTMFENDKLTLSQLDNLTYYAQQAQKAQDDEGEVSVMHPERAMGGGGGGELKVPARIFHGTPAQIETARIEREVLTHGQRALDLLRFVARDEKTIPQWCIERHGGRERRDDKGGVVSIVPKAEKRVMREETLLLQYVAGLIVR